MVTSLSLSKSSGGDLQDNIEDGAVKGWIVHSAFLKSARSQSSLVQQSGGDVENCLRKAKGAEK